MARSAAVLLLALCACSGLLVGPDEPQGPLAVFDDVWSRFDRYYAGFIDRGVDWQAARLRHRAGLKENSSDSELAAALCGLLGELRDPHVWLTTSSGDCDSWRPTDTNLAVSIGSDPTGLKWVHPELAYAIIDDSIGYVRAQHLYEYESDVWAVAVDAVMLNVRNTRRLIVDLRNNGGGYAENAIQLASRFTTNRTAVYSEQHRDGGGHGDFSKPMVYSVEASPHPFVVPTAVMINRQTVSSAEILVMALRTLPQTRLFGDTTAGALGTRASYQLVNGWDYTMSVQRVLSARGEAFEGRGIPPDVRAPLSKSDSLRRHDATLEAALDWLRR